MSKTRWIFVNRKNASDVIAVADLESARALSRLLKSVSMADDWIVRQEASLDELGYVEDVAPAAEAAVPAPAQAAVAAHAPVAAQAPAAVAPAFAAPPMPEVVQAPAAVTYSVRADATPLIEPFAEGVPPPFHMTERKNGKRRHQRYDVEFRVILVSGGKSFRTFSSNVSVGGMLLKQQVPKTMLNQMCRIFIGSVNSKESIELTCRVIGDSSNPRRLSFGDCDTATLKLLESWIVTASAAAKVA